MTVLVVMVVNVELKSCVLVKTDMVNVHSNNIF